MKMYCTILLLGNVLVLPEAILPINSSRHRQPPLAQKLPEVFADLSMDFMAISDTSAQLSFHLCHLGSDLHYSMMALPAYLGFFFISFYMSIFL